jgi:hypothetical protein
MVQTTPVECGSGGAGSTGFGSCNTGKGAAPEIRATWDKAVAADRTNDFVPAVLGYKQVLRQRDQLSPGQLKAVEEASVKLFERLTEGSTQRVDAHHHPRHVLVREPDQRLLHGHRLGGLLAGGYGLHRLGRQINRRPDRVAAHERRPQQSQAQAKQRVDCRGGPLHPGQRSRGHTPGLCPAGLSFDGTRATGCAP